MTTSVQERMATDRPGTEPPPGNSQNAHRDICDAIEAGIARLEPEWRALADLRISDAPDSATPDVAADYVLLHPDFGVALLDAAASRDDDPIPGFQRFLDSQNFAEIFAGELPIIHLTLSTEQAADLGPAVVAAFMGQPKITIEDKDWAEALATILVASDPEVAAETVWPGAEPALTLPDLGPEPDPHEEPDLEVAFSGPAGLREESEEDTEPTVLPPATAIPESELAGEAAPDWPSGVEPDTIALDRARPDPITAEPFFLGEHSAASPAGSVPGEDPDAPEKQELPLLLRHRVDGSRSLGASRTGFGGHAPYRSSSSDYGRKSGWSAAILLALLLAGGAGTVWYVETEFPTTSLDRLLPAGNGGFGSATVMPLPPSAEQSPAPESRTTTHKSVAQESASQAGRDQQPANREAMSREAATLASPPAQPDTGTPAPAPLPSQGMPLPDSAAANQIIAQDRKAQEQTPSQSQPPVPDVSAADKAPTSPAPIGPAPMSAPPPAASSPATELAGADQNRMRGAAAPLSGTAAPTAQVAPTATPPVPVPKPAAPKKAVAAHLVRKPVIPATARPLRPAAPADSEPTSLSHDAPPIDAADLPPAEPGSAQAPPDPMAYPKMPDRQQPIAYPPSPPASSPPTPLFPPTALASGGAENRELGSVGSTTAGATTAGTDGRVCRAYSSTKRVEGVLRPISGLACRGVDGRWQPVTEATSD